MTPMQISTTPSSSPVSDERLAEILANPGFGNHFTDHMLTVEWTPEQGWHAARIEPYAPLSIDPAAAVLHYAQETFEGMKAYRHDDGSVWSFRPEENAKRMVRSSQRLALPELPVEDFVACVDALVEAGEMLEWAVVHGAARYGTPRGPVEEALGAGRPSMLEIDLQGARQVRATMPDALFVFLKPPSWEELVRRLVGRGTETEEQRERRLVTAREELAAEPEFDVTIVNHEVRAAADDLVTLMMLDPSNHPNDL